MADIPDPPPAPVAIFKKRKEKANALVRKRPATPPQDSNSDSGSDYSSQDESGTRVVKRRKNNGISAFSTTARSEANNFSATKYSADTSTAITDTNDATKQTRLYVDDKKGSGRQPGNQSTDGTYKGTSNYQSFIQKNPNAPDRKIGPMKAATNIRTITTTDFAPDVCKDYKQTGYCGFGDSCKFLHAREDYKQGWQLDRDWEIDTKGKKKLDGTIVASAGKSKGNSGDDAGEKDEGAKLEEIPFACIICKQSYTNPRVTKCGHYFCEKCALDRYRKNPSCAACGADTGGVFKVTRHLQQMLDRKKQRAKEQRDNARAAGEEVGESESEGN